MSPSPADYGVWGSVVSSPVGVRGSLPRPKTSFGVFRAWKNTPDFTSPDFSLTTLEFPDFSRFSRRVVTLSEWAAVVLEAIFQTKTFLCKGKVWMSLWIRDCRQPSPLVLQWHHDYCLEFMMSHQKSNSVNQVHIYLKINTTKFHPNLTWNDGALDFFWKGSS